jgi:hypothetical protein
MAKDDPQFNLRIAADLKQKVAAAAKANDRSVTAEIIARLESTFSTEQPYSEITAVHEIIDRANFLLKHFKS